MGYKITMLSLKKLYENLFKRSDYFHPAFGSVVLVFVKNK